MIKRKKKNLIAFTLFEVIIYIAIFGLVFITFVGLFVVINNTNRHSILDKQLQNVAIYLNEHIQNSISQSTNISSPDTFGGTGADGACTVGASVNINTASCAGRGTADAVVTTSSINNASGSLTITVASATGFAANDEILVINLKGTSSNYNNVGLYETKRIASIASNVITLTQSLINQYDGTTQKIVVQRVPNYSTVTVNNGGTMTASTWDGSSGGVIFFQAIKTVTVNSGGLIDASSLGYRNRGSAWQGGSTWQDAPGLGGETYNGYAYNGCNYNGSYYCPDDVESAVTPGHEGGGGGGANNLAAVTGSVGGGGGGGGWTFGYQGGRGGAGGYGTVGSGANNGSNATGGNGGTGAVGDGGGGGTYGLPSLSKLYFGSAGGFGDKSGGAGCTGCTGGNGGGIIFINANTITVSTGGNIKSNGQNSTYSGGGAGGSIKLTAQTVSIGTGLVTASGGTSFYNGGSGRIGINATSLTGTTTPNASVSLPGSSTELFLTKLAQCASAPCDTTPTSIFYYGLSGNVMTYSTGSTLSTTKSLNDIDFALVTSMSFDYIADKNNNIVGVRANIGLQSTEDSSITTGIKTVYSLK